MSNLFLIAIKKKNEKVLNKNIEYIKKKANMLDFFFIRNTTINKINNLMYVEKNIVLQNIFKTGTIDTYIYSDTINETANLTNKFNNKIKDITSDIKYEELYNKIRKKKQFNLFINNKLNIIKTIKKWKKDNEFEMNKYITNIDNQKEI